MPDYITKKIALPLQTSDTELTNSSDQIIFADPVVLINSSGEFINSTNSSDNGSPINGANMPTGGSGTIGWLSAIWKLIGNLFNRPTINYITGVISTTGDNLLVSPPGTNLSIYISHLIIQNESSNATTILLKDSSNILRVLGQSQGDGLSIVLPERREIKLISNSGLTLNLSGANSIGYSIGYWIG